MPTTIYGSKVDRRKITATGSNIERVSVVNTRLSTSYTSGGEVDAGEPPTERQAPQPSPSFAFANVTPTKLWCRDTHQAASSYRGIPDTPLALMVGMYGQRGRLQVTLAPNGPLGKPSWGSPPVSEGIQNLMGSWHWKVCRNGEGYVQFLT